VLMSGAIATLLAQWGLIPMLHLGPRNSCLWGMALAIGGVVLVALGSDLHSITLGYALSSLGFGLFRPGYTAGSSLAVTRAEQGQSAGIIAATNGAAYIFAPAAGVLLYNQSWWLGFAVIIALCVSVIILGITGMSRDDDMTEEAAR
jgi:predicted MFS family arabinose efflux permease